MSKNFLASPARLKICSFVSVSQYSYLWRFWAGGTNQPRHRCRRYTFVRGPTLLFRAPLAQALQHRALKLSSATHPPKKITSGSIMQPRSPPMPRTYNPPPPPPPNCEGVLVGDTCWRLSEVGATCEDLCVSNLAIDYETTLRGQWQPKVVRALTEGYGLGHLMGDGSNASIEPA